MAVHGLLHMTTELAALRQQLRQALSALENGSGTEQGGMLLLLRKLAAAQNAQILARVRAQIWPRGGIIEQRGRAA